MKNYYTRGSDGRGNGHEVRVRVQPTVAGQIQSIIEQRRIPEYHTMADLVRDAIVHRLKYLEQEVLDDPALTRAMRTETSLAEANRMYGVVKRNDEVVSSMRETLAAMSQVGNPEMLAQVVTTTKDLAEGYDEPWRSRLEELAREFEA